MALGTPVLAVVAIAVVVAAVTAMIGVKIFVDINNTLGSTKTPLLDLVPLLISAVVILGIIGYFGMRG